MAPSTEPKQCQPLQSIFPSARSTEGNDSLTTTNTTNTDLSSSSNSRDDPPSLQSLFQNVSPRPHSRSKPQNPKPMSDLCHQLSLLTGSSGKRSLEDILDDAIDLTNRSCSSAGDAAVRSSPTLRQRPRLIAFTSSSSGRTDDGKHDHESHRQNDSRQ